MTSNDILPPLMPVDYAEKTEAGPTFRQVVNQALDTAGRPFAPAARRWKAESDRRNDARTNETRQAMFDANSQHRDVMVDYRRDRRAFEKAREEVKWWNVWNGERRAAAAVVRDSRRMTRESNRQRRDARKAYPRTLRELAAVAHASHLAPTSAWALLSDSWASTGSWLLSATAVAWHAGAVTLGMRHTATTVAASETASALQPSQDESDLLQRLSPDVWFTVAEPRGLADVLSAGGRLTESGIQAKLTLQGTMDLPTLMKKKEQIRAALRLKSGVRMELREGTTGGHARLTLRTRSKADGLDMRGWKPGDAWAVDTVTGEPVPVPLGKRILFAGASGSGKSWSARPLMAEASERSDHRLIVIDRKHIEARNWEHRARTASELDDIRQVFEELEAEGEARLKLIPRGQDVIEISDTRPRLTVFVDEGGELIEDSNTKHPVDEEGRKDYGDIMTMARTFARKYRAAEIILVWCTQKPALSGEGHGLDSQIAGQMLLRLSLALATSSDSRVVFGDDADVKGWKAHELPTPGYALFRDQELGTKATANILKMRAMSPKDVIALPDKPIWSRSTGRASSSDVVARKTLEASDPWAAPATDGTTLTLAADDLATEDSTPTVRVAAADRDDQIMAALRAEPFIRLSDLARVLGANKGTVSKALTRMAADGLVVRDSGGCWSVVG